MPIIPVPEDNLDLARLVITEVEEHKIEQRLPLGWTYRLALLCLEQHRLIQKLEKDLVIARREDFL